MGVMEKLNPRSQRNAATAMPQVRDAVGKILEIGDEVLIVNPSCLFRVGEITPVMDPGAPPNTMLVTLVTRLALVAQRDHGVEHLYVLRHQAEIGDGAIKLPELPDDEEGA